MKKYILIALLTLSSLATTATVARETQNDRITELLNNMRAPSGALAEQAYKDLARITQRNGDLHSLGAPAGYYFSVAQTVAGDPTATARNFISEQRMAFGSISDAVDFSHKRSRRKNGRNHERFSQTYSGISVFGAEILVQLNDNGGVEFAVSDIMRNTGTLDDNTVSIVPTIQADDAAISAIALMANEYPNVQLENTEPQLMIYDPDVVGNAGQNRLVWHTIVKNASLYLVDEVVLVDAHTGEIALHFTQIKHARNREIYDSDSTDADPGTLERSEGELASGIADVDNAYDFLGDTYDFYFNEHGRDSIDNAGMTLSATVRYCPDPNFCPYQNAFWNGSRMYFGEGLVVDDIAGHELTHGVTQYESGLVYLNESGAINESFSDMWGEWIDITNGAGNDEASVRWLMGEDSSLGAIRNMADPTLFADPDSKCSLLWYGGTDDNGGVHTNSGVGNKLCYLLTDGDTFKSVEITGMGVSTTADLFYEVQTSLLTQSSDYSDLHIALTQAAINLGWTAEDKYNLEKACLITELSKCFDPADLIDSAPPTPNPAGWWNIVPTATGLHTIAMRAFEATDTSGVEYYFGCVTDPNHDSGWQSETFYDSNSYNANTTYTFRVKARDLSDYHNETEWSNSLSTTTAALVDNLPPAPDPAKFEMFPMVVRLSPPIIRMRAMTATDENPPVQYYFTCIDVNGLGPDTQFDSAWQSSDMYSLTSVTHPGLTTGSTYTFTVKTKDALGNETAQSAPASVGLNATSTAVLPVPSIPYPTIQSAIDAAHNGDIVEVKPGTYSGNGNRDLDFSGGNGEAAITVRSIDPCNPAVTAATIINCGGLSTGLAADSHRGFDFHSGEDANSILTGFTITQGYISVDGLSVAGIGPGIPGNDGQPSRGGAISCTNGSSPTITGCVITNCVAEGGWGSDGTDGDTLIPSGGNGGAGGLGAGGAIYCDPTSRPTITNVKIDGCIAASGMGGNAGNGGGAVTAGTAGNGGNGGSVGGALGGGIFVDAANPGVTISNCTITNCSVIAGDGGNGGNGGDDALGGAGGTGGNGGSSTDALGGGAACDTGGSLTISDCTISNNTATHGDGGSGGNGGTGSTSGANGTDGADALALGGGVSYDVGCTAIIQGTGQNRTTISKNASNDGGGIWYADSATLTLNRCDISQNAVSRMGGGICAGTIGPLGTTNLNIHDSNITENTANYGAAMYLLNLNLTIDTNSTLSDNTALMDGGGIWADLCNLTMNRCTVTNNSAQGSTWGRGGGLACYDSVSTINDSIWTNNHSDYSGGAMYFNGSSWMATPDHYVNNCLITDNRADADGAGLTSELGAWVQLNNSTISQNAALLGGGISCAENYAYVEVFDSILWTNTATYGPQIAVGRVTGSFDQVANVDVYFSDVQGGENDVFMENSFTWVSFIAGNIDANPLFVAISATKPNDNYYLSQTQAGQDANSPCINIGSNSAAALGMDTLTTRTDGVNDTDTVDLGYHYFEGLNQYQLITDANSNGELKAPWQEGTYTVTENMLVGLEALPDANYTVVRWTRIENGLTVDVNETRERNYSFIITTDTTVRVDFGPRQNIIVPDEYATIQEAVDAAEDGDTVYVDRKPDGSPHYIASPDGIDLKGKAITITSANPDDPNIVAQTIIDCNGLGRAFIFQNNEDANTIIAGLTIINGSISSSLGQDCSIPDPCDPNAGGTGQSVTGNGYGGAIYFDSNTSPLIYNCVISNCIVTGGRGGDGCDGQDTSSSDVIRKAGDGGDGGNGSGNGYGGAIYCNTNSAPVIRGCTLKNNTAQGGMGGDGGDGGEALGSDEADDAGIPGSGGDGQGNGYGAAIYAEQGSAPLIINCIIKENIAQMGTGGTGGLSHTFWRWYATQGSSSGLGYGGAAYYKTGSTIDVNGSQFIGNEVISKNTTVIAGAGAIYCEPNCTAITLKDTTFTGNIANGDGGAMIIGYLNDPNITDCLFGGNAADQSGGAVFVDDANGQSVAHSSLKFTDCVFTDNTAVDFGGAVFTKNCSLTFTDCYINRNSAGSGGGIYATSDSILTITGGTISGNSATGQYGSGGGLVAINIPVIITNCLISNNTSAYSAGAILLKGQGTASSVIHNSLFVKNSAGAQGGAITFNLNTSPLITSCTFSENSADLGGKGGTLFCTYNSSPTVKDSIFDKSSRIAIYENTPDCEVDLSFCLFYHNYQGDYYESSTARTYKTYDPDDPTNPAEPNASELAALKLATSATNDANNPLFVMGDLGDYYLSQTAAGQFENSPALDNGSDLAANIAVLAGETMADYTTRTDSLGAGATGDAGTVDMGYHYIDLDNVQQFNLSTSVLGGYGTILPGSGLYYAGQTVKLTASPQPGWRIDAWTGSDNDSSTSTVNYVIMVADRAVTVAFRQPDDLFVPGEFTNIQDAIEAAKDGDRIVITAGTYNVYESSNDNHALVIDGKAITLTGTNPDDPDVVAATQILGRIYLSNVGRDTIIDGITITGNYFAGLDGCNGCDTAEPCDNEHEDGMNGNSISGGGMKLVGDASPTVRNVRFVNCYVRATNGGDGGCQSGDGGWGGWAHGGAVGIGVGGSPIFKNCLFSGNEVFPGNGGDGVPADGTNNSHGGSWGVPDDPRWFYADGLGENGGYMDYWKYSGYGGAVYCEVDSKPEFEDCTFTDNHAYGGVSGRTPDAIPGGYPTMHYRIDRFGGAVYIAANSAPIFTRCDFNDNEADPNGPTDANDEFVASADQYIAFGGAVAGEESGEALFKDCTFNGNTAGLGGAVYWLDSTAVVSGSSFLNNTAGHGGAIFITDSNIVMMDCDLTSNTATGPMGQGGAIASNASAPWIIDTEFSMNKASASGGALYFAGENDPNLKNCLVAGNTADRDGGGISANWDTQLTIANCTIADNTVTGDGFTAGFGGGLSCAYEANVNIIDSIIWGNSADTGAQISIGSTFDAADQRAAEVSVTYSNVRNGGANIFVDYANGCILNWDPNTNLTGTSIVYPWFVSGPMGNYYLSQTAAGDLTQSPCVDAGSQDAHALDFWYKHTTRTDNVLDTATVDMGYHYTRSSNLKGDFNYDGVVDLIDLAILIDTQLHWFEQDCEFPYWCHEKDLTEDSAVDYADFAEFAANWMEQETTPPNPDPMTWQTPPTSNSAGSLTMTATFATDNTGATVEYYFECTDGPGNDRGWSTTQTYTDTGLTGNTEYGYRVKARDKSGPPENETQWSIIGYAIPGEDTTAPIPDPMTWSLAPVAISPNSIWMVATTATDTSGVEYYFSSITTGEPNSALGHDSGWQDLPDYTDNALDANTTYTYIVKARDKSPSQLATAPSDPCSATTLAPGEEPTVDVNVPVFDADPNSTYWPWNIVPQAVNYGTTQNPEWHYTMSAPATDAESSNPVWYKFECSTDGNMNSGWITNSVYTTSYYYYVEAALTFHVKIKDSATPPNESGWSPWYDTVSGPVP